MYIVKGKEQEEQKKLSSHSPNFKKYILESRNKAYECFEGTDTKELNWVSNLLPESLNSLTVDTPNFTTNDEIMFLSED